MTARGFVEGVSTRPRSRGSLPRRRGRARKHTLGCAGTPVPPQPPGAGSMLPTSTTPHTVRSCRPAPTSVERGTGGARKPGDLGPLGTRCHEPRPLRREGGRPAGARAPRREGESSSSESPRWLGRALASRFGGARDPDTGLGPGREVHRPCESGGSEASEVEISTRDALAERESVEPSRQLSGASVPGGAPAPKWRARRAETTRRQRPR